MNAGDPARTAGRALLLLAGLLALSARAGREAFPPDFDVPAAVYGGAGGGTSRLERAELRHLPVILVPDLMRDHRDWTANGGVYDRLLGAGFRPFELWMLDFARAGEQMSSLEEATDDLKFYICAVMRYTGADRVQLMAQGSGCVLARLTLLKYHIAHWVDAEVYLDGPFHGLEPAPDARLALRGYPNALALAPGSDLLRELLSHGETPVHRRPLTGEPFRLRTLALRSGTGLDDTACLLGAENAWVPGAGTDGLSASAAAARLYVPFLLREARPLDPAQDRDADGFRDAREGGPDLDDGDPDIYPGALEIPGDGIDQDCNGCDLAESRGRDGEVPLASADGADSRR